MLGERLDVNIVVDQMVAVFARHPGERLHQRQLHRRLQEAERLHRHAGPPGRDAQRLLEDGVGAARQHHCHDDPAGGEVQGKGSPPPFSMGAINCPGRTLLHASGKS